jgi:hypothetical protein
VANNWYQRSASPKWMRCHNGLGTVHRISTAVNVCECIAIKCLRQNADEWFEITRMPLVIYSQPVKTSAAFRILCYLHRRSMRASILSRTSAEG